MLINVYGPINPTSVFFLLPTCYPSFYSTRNPSFIYSN